MINYIMSLDAAQRAFTPEVDTTLQEMRCETLICWMSNVYTHANKKETKTLPKHSFYHISHLSS